MEFDLDNTTQFGRFATALDLTKEQKSFAWDTMTTAGMNANDATALWFCILAKMDGLTSSITGDLSQAAPKMIEEIKGALTADMKRLIAAIPANLMKNLDRDRAAFMEALAADFTKYAESYAREEAQRRQLFRLSALGGLALVGLVVAGGLGYVAGRDTMTAEASAWSSLVKLSDGPLWLKLARLNDIGKVFGQSCGPSDGAVISGGKVCDLRMFTTAPVASSSGVDYVRLSLAEFAAKLGWLGYGLVGFAGFVVGRLFKRRAA